MKFFPLIWSNLKREKARTALTILSILVAFVLFGFLCSIKQALVGGVQMAGADRLVVRHKVSIIQLLPASYKDRMKSIPGVLLAAHQTWFGGIYQDPKNFFMQNPVVPEEFLEMHPEFIVVPEQKKAWLETRTGAIVGRKTAERFHWKIGDKVPIQSSIWGKSDGSQVWEFDIVGIFDGKEKGTDTTPLFFRYDYFDEARGPDAKGKVGWYTIIRVKDPLQAVAIAKRVDDEFENSSAETKTEAGGRLRAGFCETDRQHCVDRRRNSRSRFFHDPAGGRQHDGASRPRTDRRIGRAQSHWLHERANSHAGAGGIVPADGARRRRWAWAWRGCLFRAATRPAACCRCSFCPLRDLFTGAGHQPGAGGGHGNFSRACRPCACAWRTPCGGCDMAGPINWFSQIASITRLGLMSIPQRRGAVAATIIGIAGVVAVFVGVLSMAAGFMRAMTVSSLPDAAIVLRSGANSEMVSGFSREQTQIIADAPGVAHTSQGPLASAELFVIINVPKRSTGTDANVPLRGVESAALRVRDKVKIVQGRMFEWGKNEGHSSALARRGIRGPGGRRHDQGGPV